MAIVILALIMLVCAAPVFISHAFLAQAAAMMGVPMPVIISVWIALVAIYFLPVINAHSRRHQNTTAIFVLTFLPRLVFRLLGHRLGVELHRR